MGVLNWSLNEQDTGLTWLDGKKVWQKTIEYIPVDRQPFQIGHGIMDFFSLVDLEALIWTTAAVWDGANNILTWRSGIFQFTSGNAAFNTQLPPIQLCVDKDDIIGPAGTMPWFTQADWDGGAIAPPTIGTFRPAAVYFTLRYIKTW